MPLNDLDSSRLPAKDLSLISLCTKGLSCKHSVQCNFISQLGYFSLVISVPVYPFPARQMHEQKEHQGERCV